MLLRSHPDCDAAHREVVAEPRFAWPCGARASDHAGKGPFDFASTVEASTQNGKVMTSTFVAATRELTIRTPLGRESKTVLDAQERPLQQSTSGLLPVTYQYDVRGRVSSITQGSRSWTYGYDDSTGYLASLVDSLGRRYSFTRDANGRLLETTLPGSRTTRFTFDPNGNMTSLLVPGGGLQQFAFGNDDRMSVYTPPSAGSTVDSPTEMEAPGPVPQDTGRCWSRCRGSLRDVSCLSVAAFPDSTALVDFAGQRCHALNWSHGTE